MEKMSHGTAIDYALAAWDTSPTARHGMEAAIRAYLDARGLVMVPKEPTDGMADAYWEQTGESEFMRERVKMRAGNMYHVMLAAAPDPFGDVP